MGRAPGDSAAGSTYVTLRLTNQSGHACTLRGYPGVSAADLRGRMLGSAAARERSAPRVVRLANADTASALLRIAFADNFPSSSPGRSSCT